MLLPVLQGHRHCLVQSRGNRQQLAEKLSRLWEFNLPCHLRNGQFGLFTLSHMLLWQQFEIFSLSRHFSFSREFISRFFYRYFSSLVVQLILYISRVFVFLTLCSRFCLFELSRSVAHSLPFFVSIRMCVCVCAAFVEKIEHWRSEQVSKHVCAFLLFCVPSTQRMLSSLAILKLAPSKLARSVLLSLHRTQVTLPPLPYAYDALEPYISGEIMELHHDKHHRAYVANLNVTLAELEQAKDKSKYYSLSTIVIRFNCFDLL